MNRAEREQFDDLLESVLEGLPPKLLDLLAETPLIVDDQPSPELLAEIGMQEGDDDIICGVHSGTPLTERSVEQHGELLDTIHLFRDGILDHAGGWDRVLDDGGTWRGGDEDIIQEIRTTLLHEIGHHFGLDEDDLTELGYE